MFYEPRNVLIYNSVACEGDWEKTMASIRSHTFNPTESEMQSVIERYEKKTLTILDEGYPAFLKKGIRPPLVIYYEGDISLLQDRDNLFVVASSPEKDNSYAESRVAEIAKTAAEEGIVMVSPLTRGPCQAAVSAALEVGPCVVALSNGLSSCYPMEAAPLKQKAAKKGLVISFWPDPAPATPYRVHERNMYLGQLGKFYLVPNAKPRDGIHVTLAFALQSGADSGCFPYRADEPYSNNALLRAGSALVATPEDFLFEFAGKDPDGEEKNISDGYK